MNNAPCNFCTFGIMKIATSTDKNKVVDILSRSFAENRSVLDFVGTGKDQPKRIAALMGYAFEECLAFGHVYLTEDGKACALVLLPDQKKSSWKSTWRDVRLIAGATGFMNLSKVLNKEATIARIHNTHFEGQPRYYLWFIGVDPDFQGCGIGTRLLESLLEQAGQSGRTLLLETSTEQNLPFYHSKGISVYQQLNFGYPLYFLKG